MTWCWNCLQTAAQHFVRELTLACKMKANRSSLRQVKTVRSGASRQVTKRTSCDLRRPVPRISERNLEITVRYSRSDCGQPGNRGDEVCRGRVHRQRGDAIRGDPFGGRYGQRRVDVARRVQESQAVGFGSSVWSWARALLLDASCWRARVRGRRWHV